MEPAHRSTPMATTADAQLILSLYDLRRESVCREARAFFIVSQFLIP